MEFPEKYWETEIEIAAQKILAADSIPYAMPPGLDALKPEAIEVLEHCLSALYSGHCGRRFADNRPRSESVRRSLACVAGLMPGLIRKASRAANLRLESSPDAERVTRMFLRELPAIQNLLGRDLEAALEGDPAAKGMEEILLGYPCVEAIAAYRIANRIYREKVPLVARLMTEWSHSRTGIDIHPGASIDSGFFIDHGTGVVIGETCVIGKGVKIYQGVTLGALSFKKDRNGSLIKGLKRHPNIEDNVTIYAGATILGGETTIGRNSVIGGNCWVTESVEPNSVVALENGRVMVKPRSFHQSQHAS